MINSELRGGQKFQKTLKNHIFVTIKQCFHFNPVTNSEIYDES